MEPSAQVDEPQPARIMLGFITVDHAVARVLLLLVTGTRCRNVEMNSKSLSSSCLTFERLLIQNYFGESNDFKHLFEIILK